MCVFVCVAKIIKEQQKEVIISGGSKVGIYRRHWKEERWDGCCSYILGFKIHDKMNVYNYWAW